MKFDVNKFTSGGLAKVNIDGGYENIEFVGYMCKTTFEDEGVQETKYFTVNADGQCTGSYRKPWMRPMFSISNQEPTDRVYRVIDKPHVVTVNRFFRRYNWELDQVESHGGLACIVELNYLNKIMTVYPAFCSDEDNFNKELGLMIARNGKQDDFGIQFYFNPDKTIYENLNQAVLSGGYLFTFGMSGRTHLQKMFIRNFSRLFSPTETCTKVIAGKTL